MQESSVFKTCAVHIFKLNKAIDTYLIGQMK